MFKWLNVPLITSAVSWGVNLSTRVSRPISMLGLYLTVIFVIQCLSGIMLSFSLLGEPMLIPHSRSEEDMEDLYTDDFFWMHERGVDFIFVTLYIHFLRKMYLNSFTLEQESAWKSGAFAFLLTHGVIFFGLVLCATHLSDITLKIAANIMSTFVLKFGKIYWWLFTDQALNTDTLIRMMYLHYCLAFYLLYVSVCHAVEMHFDWKDSQLNDGQELRLRWFPDLFRSEISGLLLYIVMFAILFQFLYEEPEALGNELFTWGDVGLMVDVRFLGVMPHWYFRGYMAWLILCPHHYIGIFGLIFFMVVIYYQPDLKTKTFNTDALTFARVSNSTLSTLNLSLLWLFLICLLYCDSFLPYGRFFNRLGGNDVLMFSYFYVFVYLALPLNKIFLCVIDAVITELMTSVKNQQQSNNFSK